ncbi:flagellin FliC, partial [Salmonella enterica subsp. enterica serovar Kedougou]|nr:flagellin FliC [Salmonella enterica subsp. enterica serovar Kedougou]EIC3991960.1 flagellin FliC [Salmonella enterica subsp. enterica serovar Kedougou]
AQDNTLTIQVGANDGETIDIDLKQINSQTLGLDSLNVQKKYDVKSEAVKSGGGATLNTAGLNDTALKAGVGGATNGTAAIKDGKVFFDATDNKYFIEVEGLTAGDATKNGVYEVSVADDGTVTMPATTKVAGGMPATAMAVTETQPKPVALSTAVKDQLTDSGISAADAAKGQLVTMSYTDKNGKTIDGGFGVKVGANIYAATKNKDGSFSINTTEYTDKGGNTKTALNQLGGADGKTEVVTIDGKTYNASKAAGHNFKAQPELAEVAATTTENPLQKIDAALAQVDALRSDLGAVQNRFNSAITNLGNTVNNLSSARSRIEDSDYATEVSNMSRAQILQQAGTSVLAQANQVPQNVLSLLR